MKQIFITFLFVWALNYSSAQNPYYFDLGIGLNQYTIQTSQIQIVGEENPLIGLDLDPHISAYIGIGREFHFENDSFISAFAQIGWLGRGMKGVKRYTARPDDFYDQFNYLAHSVNFRGGLKFKIVHNTFVTGGVDLIYQIDNNSSIFPELTFKRRLIEPHLIFGAGYEFSRSSISFNYSLGLLPSGRQFMTRIEDIEPRNYSSRYVYQIKNSYFNLNYKYHF